MPTFDRGVVYLTEDDVWEVHCALARAFAEAGKPFAARLLHRDELAAAVSLPRQTHGGADSYPDVFEKAAVLARAIICGHVFLDGNKRTGMEAALIFLEYNGWHVQLPTVQYVQLALDIAGDRAAARPPIAVQEIALRLRRAASPIAP